MIFGKLCGWAALACLIAFTCAGTTSAQGGSTAAPQVDFGRDSSEWANDGECDDPRFQGPGMTATTLVESDVLRDATDCRVAYEAGRLVLVGSVSAGNAAKAGLDFGDDSSEWANDGECDDPRFEGSGMTATTLLESDALSDATDCKTAFEAGRLRLR